MGRMFAALALVLVLVPQPATAQALCRFVLGFASLREAIGAATVGDCIEDERANPENGDALQQSTKGVLVWRKASNTTAFTNGHETWVRGPLGLQRRLNSERFSWEPTEAASPPAAVAPPSSVAAALPPTQTPVPVLTVAPDTDARAAPSHLNPGTIWVDAGTRVAVRPQRDGHHATNAA